MKAKQPLWPALLTVMLAACGAEPEAPQRPEQIAPEPAASAVAAVSSPVAAPATAVAAQAASVAAQGSSLGTAGSSLSAAGGNLSARQNEFNIEINLSSDVLFDFDKAELKPEADAELEKAAEVIREKGKGIILIVGHTDSKGSDAYNKQLSLTRADAVKNWFEAHGLHQDYQTDGAGAAKPVAPNSHADGSDNPEGRAKNRRVEIVINKTKTLGE
ncbi:OmpA family protein [Uruburuella testudinis]|uniref:OmpA family protein n=1 Tax=Uruburuella testudinis TaxID=1282863 RepID=A0ABY4DV02_9NEIS|nr:OmpA family protein [Uruburuella testudinis]UOO82855.1 OmpA family protein [Uruburuella testudinis]